MINNLHIYFDNKMLARAKQLYDNGYVTAITKSNNTYKAGIRDNQLHLCSLELVDNEIKSVLCSNIACKPNCIHTAVLAYAIENEYDEIIEVNNDSEEQILEKASKEELKEFILLSSYSYHDLTACKLFFNQDNEYNEDDFYSLFYDIYDVQQDYYYNDDDEIVSEVDLEEAIRKMVAYLGNLTNRNPDAALKCILYLFDHQKKFYGKGLDNDWFQYEFLKVYNLLTKLLKNPKIHKKVFNWMSKKLIKSWDNALVEIYSDCFQEEKYFAMKKEVMNAQEDILNTNASLNNLLYIRISHQIKTPIEEFELKHQKYPDNKFIRKYLVVQYHERNDDEKLINIIEQNENNDAEDLLSLCNIYLKLGNKESAITTAKKLLKVSESIVDYHFIKDLFDESQWRLVKSEFISLIKDSKLLKEVLKEEKGDIELKKIFNKNK